VTRRLTTALHVAALAYGEALVAYHKAYDAHQKHYRLDAFDPKRVRTEERQFYAEKTKEARKEDLLVASLMYTGGRAAIFGQQLQKIIEESQ